MTNTMSNRKAQLKQRLATLRSRMEGIEDELDSHSSRDWEELAVERETDEVLEGMGLSAQHEVRMIEAALGRMDEGTYGICATCGDKISDERLDAVPFTPFCRKCAP